MKITNKHNLPQPIVNAIKKDDHVGGFLSASQFNKSPRQFWLEKRHEATRDASDCIWAIFGTAFHKVLEEGLGEKDHLGEHYLVHSIGDKLVSGTCDLFCGDKIIDYKTISVWSIIYDSHRSDWEKQLNVYAWLWRKAQKKQVKALEIVGFLRDWSRGKANDPSYPQKQVVVIPVELWSDEKQDKFVEETVAKMLKYENTPDNALPFCTDEERWYTGDKWALMKQGRKSAVKLYDDEGACRAAVDNDKLYVQHRPGEAKRCAYCDAAEFCNQRNGND